MIEALTILGLSAILSIVGGLFTLILNRILNRISDMETRLIETVSHDHMREYVETQLKSIEDRLDERRDRIIVLEAKIDKLIELIIQLRINYAKSKAQD